jgi:hypothetical protein
MAHYEEQINDACESTSASIEETLAQRGERYGEFAQHAELSQALHQTILRHYYKTHGGTEATPLPPYMVEALQMISHKLARIANGDPFYDDSWKDIAGYAELVAKILRPTTTP